MSYRELRDAMEILRAMHYPRLVSIENFRLPNFPLMAEILEWTVKRFDPNYRVPKSIQTEAERVLFVKSCVLALIQKARLKLNPRSLYQSDGYAVREFLPVLRLLYQGAQRAELEPNEEKAQLQSLRAELTAKRQDVRLCIKNTMEIPKTSATLYDLLAKEIFAREARFKALSQSLNARDVDQILRKMINETNEQQVELRTKLDSLASDEQTLDRKVEQKDREFDQLQKRLAKLQSLRPPYMDEYENYESQLRGLYREYVIQFRNLAYLQEQLENLEKADMERSHEAERNMRLAVQKMRNENEQVPPLSGVNLEEIREKAIKVYGNMTGAGLSDDEDDDDDLDDDVMNINELADEDSDDDEEILLDDHRSTAFAKRREQQNPRPSSKRSDKDSDTDDNF